MFGSSIGRGAQRIISAIVRGLASGRINPNVLTIIGVSINVGCGLLFGFGYFFWAGIILIVANLFDMLDGQVARLSGQRTMQRGDVAVPEQVLELYVADPDLLQFWVAVDVVRHESQPKPSLNAFATSAPIRPVPITPTVLPCRSRPTRPSREKLSSRTQPATADLPLKSEREPDGKFRRPHTASRREHARR